MAAFKNNYNISKIIQIPFGNYLLFCGRFKYIINIIKTKQVDAIHKLKNIFKQQEDSDPYMK